MGWSKGKGLGKSEQGATEHIKVKVKNNSLGLGTAINNEDNWIAHQDDFNQLLAELNNCHGQNNTEEPASEQTQSFSLEEKSKTSKKRVHYMKFTKGKDLSSRSETDLACIFGKRAKQMKNQDEASNGTDSLEEKEQDSDDQDSPPNPEVEVNTVTSALTMQEYFAQRMAQLKNRRPEDQASTYAPETNGNPQSQSTENSPNTSDTNESRKKKKKKKDRKVDQHDNEENADAPVTGEVTVVEQADADSKRKKKRKNKREQQDLKEGPVECCVLAAKQDTPGDIALFSTGKKKKRKNKVTPTLTPTDSTNEDDKADNFTGAEVSDKKRKKRKRREHEEEQTCVVEEKKTKKDKKKKKMDD